MAGIQTLNTLWDLLDSGFGRPSPRHGLNLLYWFANQCLEVDDWNQITVLYKPRTRVYGFRLYHNNEELLPVTNQLYFEVGNLNHEEAEDLPDYVRRDYNSDPYYSNADRIIFCITRFSVNSVYVTSHRDKWTFNPNQTFCISPQLIRTIRSLTREDFLKQTPPPQYIITQSTPERANQPSQNSAEECWEFLFRFLPFTILLYCLFIFRSICT
ncbi:uncharacterized protein LOC111195155 [Astyanax mexicanus]|uniref:uncharacterized protein LOC111195155 n=1 Tax=Astyanax mexicanus TaxID=7994 RepID=UPI0020CB5DFD|nr:uncharacterized protein LOC111195155 [Astyanax mexicanus]